MGVGDGEDECFAGQARIDVSGQLGGCLLYTSDAAAERSSVDLGGRRILKKKTGMIYDAVWVTISYEHM